MPSLDNLETLKALDPQNVLGSITGLKDQLPHAWDEAQKVDVPDNYREIKNIVMCGMGGSGLGARIIESVYGPNLKVPFTRVNDYHLPLWVNQDSLVFVSSFSGTTEETVQNLHQALDKQAKILVIASGGTLIDLANEHHLPYYQIDPVFNPSKQPRLAIGYSVIGQLVMAQKAGVIHLDRSDLDAIVQALASEVDHVKPDIPTDQNLAKQWAQTIKDRLIIYVTARHLVGSVHTVKNQANENSKHFAALFDIPELNHHLMEGLKHPETNSQNLVFVFANSILFEDRIQQRLAITQEIVQKHTIPTLVWQSDAQIPLEDAFRFIQFGAFVNFYLNVLSGTDPAPIPWVDYFKQQLGQPLGQWK